MSINLLLDCSNDAGPLKWWTFPDHLLCNQSQKLKNNFSEVFKMKVVTILKSKCWKTNLQGFSRFSTKNKTTPQAPSFFTEDLKMTQRVSLPRIAHIVFTGEPNWPFPKSDNVDLKQFYQGSRKAIETVSKSISQADYSRLGGLVSDKCMDKLRMNAFEVFTPQELSLLAIKEEDIFFQFIENAKVSQDLAEIDLVSFSLNNLAQCKINTSKVKNLQADFNRRGGVLKREDFDAREYRKLKENFEDLNPGSLVRDNEIHITNYKFEKLGDQDWQIVEIGHLNTANSWSWLPKFKWKGRAHISIQFDMPFLRVLRYDYMVDAGWISLFIYLQILAVIMGNNMEKVEDERRRQRSDPGPVSQTMM